MKKLENVRDVISDLLNEAAALDKSDSYGEILRHEQAEKLRNLANRLSAAYNSEDHCPKRYDLEGNELPPRCAFDSLKIDRLKARITDLLLELDRLHGVKMVDSKDLWDAAKQVLDAFGLMPWYGISSEEEKKKILSLRNLMEVMRKPPKVASAEIPALRATLTWIKQKIIDSEVTETWSKEDSHAICYQIDEVLSAPEKPEEKK